MANVKQPPILFLASSGGGAQARRYMMRGVAERSGVGPYSEGSNPFQPGCGPEFAEKKQGA
jgi:hypothetical protein